MPRTLTILLALLAPTAAPAEEGKTLQWKLTGEMIAQARTRPVVSVDGDDVWYFLRTSRSEGPVASRQWLRDGRYVPLPFRHSNLFGAKLDGWISQEKPQIAPLVAVATAPFDVGLKVAAGSIHLAPGPEHAVIVGWRSPVAGELSVKGRFEHAQSCCGVNSQVKWYVERGPAPRPELGFEAIPLASGLADFGTPTQRGSFDLRDLKVSRDDFVYFIVESVADGTNSPHHGDGTLFNVELTVTNATRPPPPTFEQDILPLLAENCHECHNGDLHEAGLDLTSLAGMLHGGENGPAIVRGKAGLSYLLDLVGRGEMPPQEPLEPEQVSLLARWVAAGAPAAENVEDLPPRQFVTDDDRQYWAFQSPSKRPLPSVQASDRARTAIDHFVLAKLESRGLTFSGDVDRVKLLRRVYFDLTGLPPSPVEIDPFLAEDRPDAYERLLDRLLASPHYGERWGRHWLDAAGFVDVRLYDGDASTIYLNEGMWQFRDYVLRAHDADKPWDRFLTEQLAGDELFDWRNADSYTPEMRDALIATGYLRNIEDHTSEAQYGIKRRYEVLFGLMDMVSTSTLGLTMDCCRCHNHKFDPLPQRDYYRLMACFEPGYNVRQWVKPQHRWLSTVSANERAAIDRHNASIDANIGELDARRKDAEQNKDKDKAATLSSEIARLQAGKRSYGKIQALWDGCGDAPVSRVLRRGLWDAPGAAIEAGFIEVATARASDTTAKRPAEAPYESTGLRLSLAQWLTQPDHPLTARVIVNRVWQHHFGVGLVATPGNFGRSGAGVTNLELLDWLAVDFVEHDWSLKRLHKQIMMSTVYRQASQRPHNADSLAEQVDPENKLLWRMNLRRLEAELVRDTILAASGQLDRTRGGPSVMLTTPSDGLSMVKPEPTPTSRQRRSVYLLARRVYPLKFLEVFDAPLMPINCTRRTNSATVLQSFTQLNSSFTSEHALHLARRVAQVSDGRDQQIEAVYRLTLTRLPTATELATCREFLTEQAEAYAADSTTNALRDLCHMLLCTNELLYVD